MSVGLLLITHNRIGAELLETVTSVLGRCPLKVACLSVYAGDDPDALRHQAQELAARVDGGDGVLVLTDLFGSTPANVAASLRQLPGVPLRVLAGVNLPMLVRIMNYSGLELDAVADKALSGGRDGVLACRDERG